MKKLLVLTAVAALVATTAVEARRGSAAAHGRGHPRARDRRGSLASLSSGRAAAGDGHGHSRLLAQSRARRREARAHLSEKSRAKR